MMSIFGAPWAPVYAATKGGMVQLTKSLATAWAADNVQVNCFLPGWIDTDLTVRARQDVPGLHERVLERTPAGRPSTGNSATDRRWSALRLRWVDGSRVFSFLPPSRTTPWRPGGLILERIH